MLSFLTLLIPEVRMQSFRLLSIGLGSAEIPRLLCGGLRRSDSIFSGGGPTSGSSLSARSGGGSPQLTCGPTLHMLVGLSSQPFSGFRVDPEPIGVSAASVKVAGVPRPVRNHTFSPLLALFFSFPLSQHLGQRLFSNHGMGGRRMLFLPMRCFMRFC